MSNNEDAPARIKLCGLWKQTTKDGKVYYSGGFGYGAGLQLFTNKYKEGDPKKPDLILYVVKKKPKTQDEARTDYRVGSPEPTPHTDRPGSREREDEDEIPF